MSESSDHLKQQQQQQCQMQIEKDKQKITKRILIITAEEDISLALRFALEYDTTTNSRAFKVDSFTDPLLALKKYKPGSYDLLILDIVFPKTKKIDLIYQRKLER